MDNFSVRFFLWLAPVSSPSGTLFRIAVRILDTQTPNANEFGSVPSQRLIPACWITLNLKRVGQFCALGG